MMEVSNQEIVDRYLGRFSHSILSQRSRKYGLWYFFDSRYFGYEKHVFEIKKRDTVDFFDYLNQLDKISFQTKVNKWNIFRSFLQFVMEYYEDFLIIFPRYCVNWRPVHKKPVSNKDVVMTREDVKRILDYSYNYSYYYYLIFRLLAETGMRIGEFLGIDCEHLNVERRYVETEDKTGRNIYYFSKGLADHLTLYMKERELKQNRCKALFLFVQGGRYTRRPINRYIRKTVSRVGIDKWISSHTFRKTINTLRKKMGCPRKDRKVLLWHKVSDVNYQCYVKLNYDDYIQLYDKWNPYKNI